MQFLFNFYIRNPSVIRVKVLRHWGKGIATEAAIAVRDYAFNMLEIPLLISIINHKNDASKRVAKKVGMRLMKQTNFKNVLVDVFCLKREEDISN